jgi:hypothetical protein
MASTPSHLDLVFVSHCSRPVEVCYASQSCLTIADAKPRRVRAATGGLAEVFVSLKGAPTGVFADATFSEIVIEDSCARLYRSLGSSR